MNKISDASAPEEIVIDDAFIGGDYLEVRAWSNPPSVDQPCIMISAIENGQTAEIYISADDALGLANYIKQCTDVYKSG